MLLLHYVNYPTLADTYLGRTPSGRAGFLESSVDPLSLSEVQASTEPRDIDKLEWFGSPDDICRAFVGLQQLSHRPKLAPIASVFSVNNGDLGLDPRGGPLSGSKAALSPAC